MMITNCTRTTCVSIPTLSTMLYKEEKEAKGNTKLIVGYNDLATVAPKVATMWSSKNTYAPNNVSAKSTKTALFVCPDCQQEFKAPVCSVVKSVSHGNTGCPVCSGRKVVPGINDLATQYPKVSAMWSDKNDYAPNEIPSYSSRRNRSRHSTNACHKLLLANRTYKDGASG